jgi:RNA 2',3'-cyclic 3'-phosphodiesterase
LPVRWVEQDALHLTLKFLGSIDPATVSRIVVALEEAVRGARPFTLPLGDFGAFPTVERPRVIWVGCEGVPPLELLQHRLELGMEPLGFPIEGRTFRPHLTLGRVKKEARPSALRGLGQVLAGLDFQGESLVESIELMESVLGPKGSHYRPVHSATLKD